MKVLIVVSSETELNAIHRTFPGMERLNESLWLKEDKFPGLHVMNTGTGMVAMCYHLTKELQKRSYDLIINAGICGSFRKDILIGEVVIVTEDTIADLGADSPEGFLDIFTMGLTGRDSSPFKNGFLLHDPGKYRDHFSEMREVRAVSLNTVSGTQERIDKIKNRWNPDIESMEGAGFFYVCRSEKSNFVQLRSISNYVEPRNRNSWKIEEALDSLSEKLGKILEKL